MKQTLGRFLNEPLFDAVSHLLAKLNIQFDRETAEAIDMAELYGDPMPKYLDDALQCVKDTYYIGVVNDQSLAGAKTAGNLADVSEDARNGGKYDGLFVFACEVKRETNFTRAAASALTRAFNRIALANPVILITRQDCMVSISTCERMEYSQERRQANGEKLGKVRMLRNINCTKPHRGHVDILEALGGKPCDSFEALYKHWMEAFSCELLTKKFYSELSDWYAWAVMVAKFPNDLHNRKNDAKCNHEACIRLITRLIFVWFLKRKNLVPEELFDEDYIRENLIENFNPHDSQDPRRASEKSRYYRLILQNLFFATLNCPIVAEGGNEPDNRRFRDDRGCGYLRNDYNVNNLMRYKSEFADRGADKFIDLVNGSVPFLNGGLFDCLDDKPNGLYHDGFSERKESLERLSVPDYLFFGDEAGRGIDLSQWYDDRKKKSVSARGIIDILKRYSFTIEENTPYDQEVSLDPELLGKVFENLLAAYNPETRQSARKQTGSFYTPREIVRYMVDESLVAHLKRLCGDALEPQFRQLLGYEGDEVTLADEQRKRIMQAIYDCRVLDPACGSGAFPMGMLQQMVHVLKRIDPTNEMWKEMMVDFAAEDARKELMKVASGNNAEKTKVEENGKARLDDIANAFNQSVNFPDYARKLYLIEHCIHGVDIQPIAIQISKLRFFISLVVDQKPTTDAMCNFNIRPLPNLEAKFVAANTLIPLDRSLDLFSSCDEIRAYEEKLQDIDHRIFLAKKNSVKKELQKRMYSTREEMAKTMKSMNAIGSKGYNQLMGWRMFDQNTSAEFFDPEWMFGVNEGFDIVIGNPPYVSIRTKSFDKTIKDTYKRLYTLAVGQYDLYTLFIEKACIVLRDGGILSYIIPTRMLSNENFMSARQYVIKNIPIYNYVNALMPFEMANVEANIMVGKKGMTASFISSLEYNVEKGTFDFVAKIPYSYIDKMPFTIFPFVYNTDKLDVFGKLLKQDCKPLSEYVEITRGFECGYNDNRIGLGQYKLIKAEAISNYFVSEENLLDCNPDFTDTTKYKTKEIFLQIPKYVTKFCANEIQFALDNVGYCNTNSVYNCQFTHLGKKYINYVLALLNSKVTTFWFNTAFMNIDSLFPHIQKNQLEAIPIPKSSEIINTKLSELVQILLNNRVLNEYALIMIDNIVYHLYNLTYDDVLVIDPDTPITRDEYENFKKKIT